LAPFGPPATIRTLPAANSLAWEEIRRAGTMAFGHPALPTRQDFFPYFKGIRTLQHAHTRKSRHESMRRGQRAIKGKL